MKRLLFFWFCLPVWPYSAARSSSRQEVLLARQETSNAATPRHQALPELQRVARELAEAVQALVAPSHRPELKAAALQVASGL